MTAWITKCFLRPQHTRTLFFLRWTQGCQYEVLFCFLDSAVSRFRLGCGSCRCIGGSVRNTLCLSPAAVPDRWSLQKERSSGSGPEASGRWIWINLIKNLLGVWLALLIWYDYRHCKLCTPSSNEVYWSTLLYTDPPPQWGTADWN